MNYRQFFTDRINFFAALSDNVRTGKSEVFNTRDESARFNLDYQLSPNKTFYLTNEMRRGDFIATSPSSTQLVEIASWSVPDDVFTSPAYFDYRLKGRTTLWTLGYNVSFGPKDSLDFSWRRAKSVADLIPSNGLAEVYLDNQYSINYLMAF